MMQKDLNWFVIFIVTDDMNFTEKMYYTKHFVQGIASTKNTWVLTIYPI